MNEKELILDYVNGMGVYDVCSKYHIGKIKLKKILSSNNITLRKRGGQNTIDYESFVVKDYKQKKYVEHDGYHYVAVDKNSGEVYNDYMNNGGNLTTHIRNVYNVDIPTLYDRRMYYMKTGDYWWEQWFDIKEEKDKEYKMCAYCEWKTEDVNNLSGAYIVHLKKEHGLSVEEHLKKHPEDAYFFKKQVNQLKKDKYLEDENNYVVCPICNEKLCKITYSHLKYHHNIGMIEFKKKYPNIKILSNTMLLQTHSAMTLSNLVVSKNRFISSYEKDIREYLKSLGVEHDANRQILIGKEIDILIPRKNIGIEFDGLKWHTEFFGRKKHKYHLEKTELCNQKGYGLIHIFEDEYVNHKEIVLAKIKHMIGMDYDLPKIPGRKITIREIKNKEAKPFLDEYHIQGYYKSTVYVGGFYEDKLVAVMSFKNGNIKNDNWELVRFATDYHYIYQGVGSKLFTYFLRNYDPNEIVSFADRRWTLWKENNLYTKLGFVLEKITKPDYRYYNENVDRYKRVHKMSMSKSVLSKKHGFPIDWTELEMARELGYDRIWDCGLFKYVWKKLE